MKIKNWNQFLIKESFGISKQLADFIKSKSIDWSEFEDSLWDIIDDKDFEITKSCHIVDERGHIINVDLEEDKQYKLEYEISIRFLSEKKGTISDFKKIQDKLKTAIDSIEPMIARVSSKGLKLKKNDYIVANYPSGDNMSIKYLFTIQFESIINKDELQKVYNDYKKGSYGPEFEKGIKRLADHYKTYQYILQVVPDGIDLHQYLDYNVQPDIIMVGFVTEDDIYGIGEYDIESEIFTIDWNEVDNSIEWYFENLEDQ